MPFAKLVVIQPGHAARELMVQTDVVSFGRALDNLIPLEDDSGVSRYHAEIEATGDSFTIFDLDSRNGTTVNDEPIKERQLQDGDLICLGGSTIVEFHLSDTPWEAREARQLPEQDSSANVRQIYASRPSYVANYDVAQTTAVDTSSAVAPQLPAAAPQVPAALDVSSGLSAKYIVGGILGGLVLTGIIGGVLWYSAARGCQATVRITNPQSGTVLKGPIPIRVEAEKTDCVDRLIYQLDGVKVASSEIPPYQATLDPADISGLTRGNHVLTVTVEDVKGNRTVQPEEVMLGFENVKAPETKESQETSSSRDSADQRSTQDRHSLSSADIKDMTDRLLKELSSKREYIVNRDLLHQINDRSAEYANAGFYARARGFRDVINDAFVNEQGLEKPVGFILAMSRSNFSLAPASTTDASQGPGLWRVPQSLAQTAGYIGRCGTATLSDKDQKCAAMVAAAYMKALEVDLFQGDILYGIACFGMEPKTAAQWRDQLPPDRRDLWNVIKSPEQRDRLARFLAAGIVGENPQRFGLDTDTPLSNLYPK